MIETEIHFKNNILPKGYAHTIFLPCVFPVGSTLRISDRKYDVNGKNYDIDGCFKITSIGFDTTSNYMILTVEPTEDWIITLELF